MLFYLNQQRKETGVPLNFNVNWERLYPTKPVKYLGIKIDGYLNWNQQISDLAIKLKRSNAVLSTLRYFIDRKKKHFKAVYHAIFEVRLKKKSHILKLKAESCKFV